MLNKLDHLVKEGLEACRNGEFQTAVLRLTEVLKIDKSHKEALYNRAKAYFKLKNNEGSLEDFTNLILLEPTSAYYYCERGVAFHVAGENKKALEDFDHAQRLDPDNPYRYSSRAYIKERLGDLEGCIADYERAIELDPEDMIAYNNKGLVEEKLGYELKSKRSLEKADQLDPFNSKNESFQHNRSVELDYTSPAVDNSIKPVTHWSIIKKVFSTQDGFKEFWGYVKNTLKR